MENRELNHPPGTSLFRGGTPCHQCDLDHRQPGRDPPHSDGSDLAANPEVTERIETIVRTAMEASTMTRRLIELSHDLTAIDSDSSSGPVRGDSARRLAPAVRGERKDQHRTRRRNGYSTCPLFRPSGAGPNSFAPC